MTERAKLVLEWHRRWQKQQGRVDVAELCRIFGISTPCGYRWIHRFRDGDFKPEALLLQDLPDSWSHGASGPR